MLLRAPTGETREVPDSLAQHYIDQGAQPVQAEPQAQPTIGDRLGGAAAGAGELLSGLKGPAAAVGGFLSLSHGVPYIIRRIRGAAQGPTEPPPNVPRGTSRAGRPKPPVAPTTSARQQNAAKAQTRPRGASTPELARRQAGMKGVALEVAQGGGPSLEEQLAQSIEAAQALRAAEQPVTSAGIRGIAGRIGPHAGGALGVLAALLGLAYANKAEAAPQQTQPSLGEGLLQFHPDIFGDPALQNYFATQELQRQLAADSTRQGGRHQ